MMDSPKEPSYDYIRGLVDGEGCFTFCKAGAGGKRIKLPTFAIGMSGRDKKLILAIKEKLGLRNRVYEYRPRFRKDGYKRDGVAVLMVRDVGQLKNIIIPLFYRGLIGNKMRQFEDWVEKIGNDPDVPERYKFIYKIYKAGFYDKNPKFLS
jgi:hypothetical protein